MRDDLRATLEGFLLEQLVMELGNARAGLAFVSPTAGVSNVATTDLALARIGHQLSRLEDSARRMSRLLAGNRVAANEVAAQKGMPVALPAVTVPAVPASDAACPDEDAKDDGDTLLARLIAADSFTTLPAQGTKRLGTDAPMFRSCRV